MFNGNTDSETVVYNKLTIPIKTRFIRLLPMQWKNQISMRIEVYGCPGIKLIMLEKIGLFYNRVALFFYTNIRHWEIAYTCLACARLLVSADERKYLASSENQANERQREERRGEPVRILQIPRSVHYPAHFMKNRFSC